MSDNKHPEDASKIYYLFSPNKQLKNPHWYKYLKIQSTYTDYIRSYRPEYIFKSKLFTVYICEPHETYDTVDYNVCLIDADTVLCYYDDIVFIKAVRRCDNTVLKILNKYQNIQMIKNK